LLPSLYGEKTFMASISNARELCAKHEQLLGEIVMAKSLEATPVELGKTMHAHPTLSEMIMEAALDAEGEAVHI